MVRLIVDTSIFVTPHGGGGFVTFVKSNAKALLTLRIKSALRSPRGYAAPAGAYAMFATCTGFAKHGTVAACPTEHSPPIV